jgi:hypothetical protein
VISFDSVLTIPDCAPLTEQRLQMILEQRRERGARTASAAARDFASGFGAAAWRT